MCLRLNVCVGDAGQMHLELRSNRVYAVRSSEESSVLITWMDGIDAERGRWLMHEMLQSVRTAQFASKFFL